MLDSAQVQPPAAEPHAPAGEAAPPPAPASEEPTEDRSWWSRLWNTRGHHDESVQEASPPEESNGSQPIAPTVTLTEEELNQRIARGAQSLHDREIARRNKEQTEAERKRLRREDPWQFAAQDEERERSEEVRQQQTGELMTLLGHVGRQHDAVSIDPIINALPEAERQRIMQMPQAGQGLPGRKLIVDEALKTYGKLEYERGVREARARLTKDAAFRKSVLAELRGERAEPELYPGNGSPTNGGLPDDSVSSVLRRQYFQR